MAFAFIFSPLLSCVSILGVSYTERFKDAFSNSTLMLRSIEESGMRQARVQELEYYPCLAASCSTDSEGKFLWTDGMKGNQV